MRIFCAGKQIGINRNKYFSEIYLENHKYLPHYCSERGGEGQPQPQFIELQSFFLTLVKTIEIFQVVPLGKL